MRKAIIAAAALGAVLSALPAAAQSYGNGYGQRDDRSGYGYDRGQGYAQQPAQRLWQLRTAVDRLVQRGRLDRREAVYFRRAVANLTQLDQRYRYNGYTAFERRDIDQRSQTLLRSLRQASDQRGYGNRDDDRRGDGRWDQQRDDRRDYDRGYQRDDDNDDDDDRPYRR